MPALAEFLKNLLKPRQPTNVRTTSDTELTSRLIGRVMSGSTFIETTVVKQWEWVSTIQHGEVVAADTHTGSRVATVGDIELRQGSHTESFQSMLEAFHPLDPDQITMQGGAAASFSQVTEKIKDRN